ncbi:hypothetical protein KJY73_00275 [Bowmanella sp. Y26]|uniref:hypothetical protein n=1 Tax=Bowmanella yangjiangensis TaxID=2811230 RepID=UPI001BDD3FAE|nr:hypothetical protein [Bowmanella yangjiangensis]MBT1061978.1 hypothetical protein [Bowmanella yangjiangensis]
MPRVIAKADNLNELNQAFAQSPLNHPVFINSVPKCGTHLMRNIFRMFVPVAQQYHDEFIQIPILRQHLRAFDGAHPKLSWGHLLFSDESAMAMKGVQQLLIVRDPFDWVLARARFFLSDSFVGSMEHLKGGRVNVEQMLNMMIFGIHQRAPSLLEIYTHNAAAWLGTGVKLVRYEDVIRQLKQLDTPDAEAFFRDLLAPLGPLPSDWRERVKIGSDRQHSGTARENLSGQPIQLPDELPTMQKQLVEFAAPGLRRLLGYF